MRGCCCSASIATGGFGSCPSRRRIRSPCEKKGKKKKRHPPFTRPACTRRARRLIFHACVPAVEATRARRQFRAVSISEIATRAHREPGPSKLAAVPSPSSKLAAVRHKAMEPAKKPGRRKKRRHPKAKKKQPTVEMFPATNALLFGSGMDQDAAPAPASDDEEEPEAASPRSPWRIEHDVQVTERPGRPEPSTTPVSVRRSTCLWLRRDVPRAQVSTPAGFGWQGAAMLEDPAAGLRFFRACAASAAGRPARRPPRPRGARPSRPPRRCCRGDRESSHLPGPGRAHTRRKPGREDAEGRTLLWHAAYHNDLNAAVCLLKFAARLILELYYVHRCVDINFTAARHDRAARWRACGSSPLERQMT